MLNMRHMNLCTEPVCTVLHISHSGRPGGIATDISIINKSLDQVWHWDMGFNSAANTLNISSL